MEAEGSSHWTRACSPWSQLWRRLRGGLRGGVIRGAGGGEGTSEFPLVGGLSGLHLVHAVQHHPVKIVQPRDLLLLVTESLVQLTELSWRRRGEEGHERQEKMREGTGTPQQT
jgi:hypothetical protein